MYVMLAYVLYSKDLGLVMKALDTFRDKDIKFDVDLDRGYIYINEAEAARPGFKTAELLESIIVPRKCFLRTVSCSISPEGDIKYGADGTGVSTGTKGLLARIKNTTSVEIKRGFFYYPRRKAFWIIGEGYFSIKKFEEELRAGKKGALSIQKHWEMLKKLVTIDD